MLRTSLMKKHFPLFLLATVLSPFLQAAPCVLPQQKQVLQLSYPAQSPLRQPVDVQFELNGDVLSIFFEVRSSAINAKPTLGPGEYPFQHDVVELFISAGGRGSPMPYYEIELSPYDQIFEVRIDDLKKPFINNIDMGIEHEVKRTPTGWTAQMSIPLEGLNWNGDPASIIGNAYAIQGRAPSRSYWSLSLPHQLKPNFHQPQFFKPLLSCE